MEENTDTKMVGKTRGTPARAKTTVVSKANKDSFFF
jgi:hypothetical protein